MHVFDECTNIAANLHRLCWSFIWPPGSTISLCILGNFFVLEMKQVPDVPHLPPISGQLYWLKLVHNCVRDSSLLEIDCLQLLGL